MAIAILLGPIFIHRAAARTSPQQSICLKTFQKTLREQGFVLKQLPSMRPRQPREKGATFRPVQA